MRASRKGSSGHGHKIVAVRTFHLRADLPHPLHSAQEKLTCRETLLVEIEAEGGLTGWGECAGPPPVTQAGVCEVYGPHLLGKSAETGAGVLWSELWRAGLPWGRKGVLVGALSGLDMALWDLRAKLHKIPVCELMGGRLRERVPCYAGGLFFPQRPEASLIPALVAQAQVAVDEGFRGIKAQIGRNFAFDSALVRALRAALPSTPLFADAQAAYDFPEAVAVGRALEDSHFSALENPLSFQVPDKIAPLAHMVCVPLWGGRDEQTRWGFQNLLTGGGLSAVLPDLSYCGGPTEALQIRAVAHAHGVNVSPAISRHATQIGFAAALHFLASDVRHPERLEPPPAFLEWDICGPAHPLRDALFAHSLERDGGTVRVPGRPRLGRGTRQSRVCPVLRQVS